jgi:hypothetical protein
MKNAALFAFGLLSSSLWLQDSARCQTSLAPPLSLAPPSAEQGSAPPTTTNNSVWPPMAPPNVSPLATKSSAQSAKTNVEPSSSSATDDVLPPTATAKRSVPPLSAKDARPRAVTAEALPSVTAKDTPPTPSDNVSSARVIGRLAPSSKPGTDYDGFSVDIVDDSDTSSQATRPVRSRSAKQSKHSQESDSIAGHQSVDRAEEENLKRKLTICRGCK